jgi:hypothetical protein
MDALTRAQERRFEPLAEVLTQSEVSETAIGLLRQMQQSPGVKSKSRDALWTEADKKFRPIAKPSVAEASS